MGVGRFICFHQFSLLALCSLHRPASDDVEGCVGFVCDMDVTFPAIAGFQDSDFCKKAMKMALRCILNVALPLSGFKL